MRTGVCVLLSRVSTLFYSIQFTKIGNRYGWRVGMMVPAAIGITAAVIILVMVKTSPREVGLPLVDLDSTDARKDEGEGR